VSRGRPGRWQREASRTDIVHCQYRQLLKNSTIEVLSIGRLLPRCVFGSTHACDRLLRSAAWAMDVRAGAAATARATGLRVRANDAMIVIEDWRMWNVGRILLVVSVQWGAPAPETDLEYPAANLTLVKIDLSLQRCPMTYSILSRRKPLVRVWVVVCICRARESACGQAGFCLYLLFPTMICAE
jgi:hypothetical protein